jgi:predicted phosphodiesterase
MRMAVIADIHGNLRALEAVLKDIRQFAPDLVIDLGDCVSGPLWPRETFMLLESLAFPTVRGNHDRQVAFDDPATMGASDRFAFDRLTQDQRAKLGSAPFQATPSGGFIAFHATPASDERCLLDHIRDGRLVRAEPERIADRLALVQGRIVVCAHSHRPDMIALQNGVTIVNPGSVGCPAYSDPTGQPHVSEAGSPHARYAVIDVEQGAVRDVHFRALTYDHGEAANLALKNGRPDWAHALQTGFMPTI